MEQILKLIVVFAVLIVLMKLKFNLSIGLIGAIFVGCLVYGLGVKGSFDLIKSTLTIDNLLLVLTVFFVYLLQNILHKRDLLTKAQVSMSNIFNNRRINVSVAPIFVGLLPSAAVVNIAGDIVDEASKNEIPDDEKAFLAGYFRHIPESFLPTYTSIILMSKLSGVKLSSFVILMLPVVIALYFVGYFVYVTKIGKETGLPKCLNKKQELINLFKCLWSIGLVVVLILGFNLSTFLALSIVLVLLIVILKIKANELKEVFIKSINVNVLVSTYLIVILKELLIVSGVIEVLPDMINALPIPDYLVFVVLFFVSTILVGSNAASAMFTAMAFLAIKNGSTALMVLLSTTSYIAMQFSPTHICYHMIADKFKVPFSKVTRYMLPIACIMLPLLIGYYLVLVSFGL